MIEIRNVTKTFDKLTALREVSAKMEEGHVFGLIGTNGAGKSTLMRLICGIYAPDTGVVEVDGVPVYENPAAKSKIFYLSDDPYFFPGATSMDMARFYHTFYPNFDMTRFEELMDSLHLDIRRKINTFSKGMKKQLSMMLGICSGTKYLLCDETFDGLDPVMRQAVKRLFLKEIEDSGLTPVISSHNLRELEDICEHVGLLHDGGILFTKDLEDMKLNIHKLQCVLKDPADLALIEKEFPILQSARQGALLTLTLRGDRERIRLLSEQLDPAFWELLPLTLEEIFISETEVFGYDFSKIYE
ncbi:MAG: ABC transporter ATP-binding protein [Clostridium sp.]|nr:ABC transporter ATP-binding protein [Acetatifactor muris]MCM1525980.1 ABC transporter ATP-binding protein [Bacteroides sp.]MCM1562260.1 ABC transporter ATP-binding protein [Clostridium sp.]